MQGVSAGMTLGVGVFDWLAANSGAIAPAAMIATVIVTVIFGYCNAKSNALNAKSNAERNRVNKRDIVEDLIIELRDKNKKNFDVDDIIKTLRK